MGKHIEALKRSAAKDNKVVTEQEFINVMCEFLEEQIEYLERRTKEIFGEDSPTQ